MEFSDYGVVFDEGKKVWMKGVMAKLSGLEKITETELEEIRNDFDPIEAPPGPYKVQPENQGQFPIFFFNFCWNYFHYGGQSDICPGPRCT